MNYQHLKQESAPWSQSVAQNVTSNVGNRDHRKARHGHGRIYLSAKNDTLTVSGPWADSEPRYSDDGEESLSCWSRVLIPYRQQYWGRDRSDGIATRYGMDGLGIEFLWGARFSAPVQTKPGANRDFPGVKSTGSWCWKSSPI